jgi:hypothetical protein
MNRRDILSHVLAATTLGWWPNRRERTTDFATSVPVKPVPVLRHDTIDAQWVKEVLVSGRPCHAVAVCPALGWADVYQTDRHGNIISSDTVIVTDAVEIIWKDDTPGIVRRYWRAA